MIDFSQAVLSKIIVHQVGNKLKEEQLNMSKTCVNLADVGIKNLLMRYFLTPFKDKEFYCFSHESELSLNEMYTYTTRIFSDPDSFFIQSVHMAKHLYEKSTHPKVKGGEVYIVYLENCAVGSDYTNAVGIFKSENKDTYLKVYPEGEGFGLNQDDGININKLDKGCIIFDLEGDKGYKICIVDAVNKNEEARYWKDDFLHLSLFEDNRFHTKNYISLCQGFVSEKFKEDFEVSKVDEIDFMNKSLDFFKKKEVFDLNEFSQEVIGQPEIIDSFNNYKREFQESRSVHIFDEFDISASAVKQSSKFHKKILKLDKNFHIYIHGNKDFIEKGFDEEKGMSFYKIFYKNEH